MPLAKSRDFNILIDNRLRFSQLVIRKQKACEKLIEMSGNSNYTTGNVLDYSYHQALS